MIPVRGVQLNRKSNRNLLLTEPNRNIKGTKLIQIEISLSGPVRFGLINLSQYKLNIKDHIKVVRTDGHGTFSKAMETDNNASQKLNSIRSMSHYQGKGWQQKASSQAT